MKYAVSIDAIALAGIEEHFQTIYLDSPRHAERWLRELYTRITELETMPRRFAFAREHGSEPEELRQFIHYSHRVIYTVSDEQREVVVLHVRHAARQDFNEPS